MKKTALTALLAALCLLVGACTPAPVLPNALPTTRVEQPTPPPTPAPSSTPEPTAQAEATPEAAQATSWQPPFGAFAPEDLTVDSLSYLATAEQVEEAFGKPLITEPYTEVSTGTSFETLAFDGLVLHLLEGKTLTRASLLTDDYAGPRGLKVGDTLERVLQVFVRDADITTAALEAIKDDPKTPFILYSNPDAAEGIAPPSAVIEPEPDENGEFIVRLLSPAREYTPDELSSGSYRFGLHAGCLFYINAKKQTVSRIYWFYNPLAE